MRSNLSAGDSAVEHSEFAQGSGKTVPCTAESLHHFVVPLPLTREAWGVGWTMFEFLFGTGWG